MNKFQVGDKVRIEDGREGVIETSGGPDNWCELRIGNKFERWHCTGLSKITDYKIDDEVIVQARIAEIHDNHFDLDIERVDGHDCEAYFINKNVVFKTIK